MNFGEKIFTLILFVILLCSNVFSQQTFILSGTITDDSLGNPIEGVSISIQGLQKGTSTDDKGNYSLNLEEGKYTLLIEHISLEDIVQEIDLNKNLTLDLKSKLKAHTTKEVQVTAEQENKNIQSIDPGTIELTTKEIESVPSILGQSDAMSVLQLLPGVQSAAQGVSGFYVRGGGPDQNLILLDGAPIYNASHLFGFYSIFNTNAIENIKLIKGDMPANYGGRLSSVLDITASPGNDTIKSAIGGVGLISSDLTVSGPIKSNTVTYSISARRTYIDLLVKPFGKMIDNARGWGYYFYDFNGKINWKVSEKDQISLTGYNGKDDFSMYNSNAGFGLSTSWGNSVAVLKWQHIFNDQLLMVNSLIHSGYKSSIDIAQGSFLVNINSGISDWTAKSDFTWIPSDRLKVKLGGNYTFHKFSPNNLVAKTDEIGKEDIQQQIVQYSNDVAFYTDANYTINKVLQLRIGLRYTYFQHIGPFDRYLKDELGEIDDTLHFDAGQHIIDYQNLEPRTALRILLNSSSSLKLSYSQNHQYIHLASYSTISMPTDIWIPSSSMVKPQRSTQYALGYYKNLKDNKYETSLELYHKTMENQIEFKDSYSPEDDVLDNPDNNFVFGDGMAYGGEIFIKKKSGNTTGWLGYTLSLTSKQFDEINAGETFYAKYDRRHDFSIIWMQKLNEKWSFSAVFVYASGNASTMPKARYTIEGQILNEYGKRNDFRMPDYHRLDISAEFKPQPKKKRKYTSSWNFGIYNVYNRNNAYFIYFDDSNFFAEGIYDTKAKQVGLFPIMPSVRWNFNF